jgi:hypothetical protein
MPLINYDRVASNAIIIFVNCIRDYYHCALPMSPSRASLEFQIIVMKKNIFALSSDLLQQIQEKKNN